MPAEGEGKNSKPAANHSMMTAIALYDKAGDLIYMGQSKGTIIVLDSVSLKFLDIVKVCICTLNSITFKEYGMFSRRHAAGLDILAAVCNGRFSRFLYGAICSKLS